MDSSIESLNAHFKTLRTGRANAAMLDTVQVDYYGTPTPISQAASVKVPEPALIVVEPWDKSMVGADRESHPHRRPRLQPRLGRQGHSRARSRS